MREVTELPRDGAAEFALESMWNVYNRRCGEDDNGFYDRDGCYFREGVDPRNYYGRFLPDPNRGLIPKKRYIMTLGGECMEAEE